ncbi:hypothetical protein [Thalassobium sp. R2A62]|uniref:hypothetical protein n=1 Tax=Thalassobium sp. R2A62 TaxID=633131 RepID=UPI0001B1D7D1|nr:membrane protein, putative [Thalassobium sp. R2A62]
MFSRLTGAIVRAILVVLLVAMPSLLLPFASSDTTQTVTLVAIFAAAFTLFEYGSTYPSLVEFRDAPPFNRIRYLALFTTVLLLTLIARGAVDPTKMTMLLSAIGTLIGQSIDFPYSPVRLVVLMMPSDTDAALVGQIRTAAGLSYLISLISLAVFLICLRLGGWPNRGSTFNVWVNLPTFDPTAGSDVVERLNRDGRVNIILGFLLPFIIPTFMKLAADLFDPITLGNSQTMIWTMTAWAFLPASLFMRGIAMGRVAQMISDKRRQTYAAAKRDGALVPA